MLVLSHLYILQELSLARGCINHRTAVHEMIHALGFAHEHVRSDRDNYVHIYWQNISPGTTAVAVSNYHFWLKTEIIE